MAYGLADAKTMTFSFVLLLTATTASAVRAAPEMIFTPTSIGGRAGLSAAGQITASTPDAFRRLAGAKRGIVIFIDSPGGSVAAAMKLGAMFHRYGVTAVVAGVTGAGAGGSMTAAGCFSACVYALMGASRRVVPAQSEVGIHEMSPSTPTARYDGSAGADDLAIEHEAMRAILVRYAVRMGVDPSVIVAAESIPPGDLRILSQAEIRKWRLASRRR